MKSGLEELVGMEYPGRFVIVGRSAADNANFAVYGITGRSPSSQARVLVESPGTRTIRTAVTDPQELEKGSAALLIYPAIAQHQGTIVVGNGAQTKLLYTAVREYRGVKERDIMTNILIIDQAMHAHYEYNPKEDRWIDITAYEPDSPNNTPRISAIITPRMATLQIISHEKNRPRGMARNYQFHLLDSRVATWNEFIRSGEGRLIATYTGENKNPLPSFEGRPKDVSFSWKTPQEAVDEVYDALAPKDGKPDLRVSVASMFVRKDRNIETAIRNRHALPKELL